MQMTMQGKVTGIKWFKSNIDGQEIDSCTIFVESRLKGDNAKGYASQSFKWGKSENAKRLAHLEFPIVAEVIVENETDGRGGLSQVVVDVRPVSRAGVKAAA